MVEEKTSSITQNTNSKLPANSVWRSLALAGIVVLALFFIFFNLEQEGYANLYYAAAVKSMLTGWRNFFAVCLAGWGGLQHMENLSFLPCTYSK